MFTARDIQKIMEHSELPGEFDKNIILAYSTKQERKNLIATSDDEYDREVAAALEIQRVWRGFRARLLLFHLLHPDASVISTGGRTTLLSELSGLPPTLTKLSSGRLKSTISLSQTQSKLEVGYQRYSEESLSRHELPLPFREFCAGLIQKWWRKTRERLFPLTWPGTRDLDEKSIVRLSVSVSSKDSRKLPSESVASKSELSNDVLGDELSREDQAASLIQREDQAASLIQRAWRKHIDIQVYKYYRDLINFRAKGDPAMMLKCINPRESELLDSAAGIHIRFRLGGQQFPPTIYYKIYTHRNIADIGAFAPRDYTKAVNKVLPGKYIHNEGIRLKDYLEDSKDDWYKRWENNGWRPVSDKVLKHLYQDSITYESSKRTTTFHHSKLARKQDVEKRKKQKKVEWMKKMYPDLVAKYQKSVAKYQKSVAKYQKSEDMLNGFFTFCDVCHACGRQRLLNPKHLVVLPAGPICHGCLQWYREGMLKAKKDHNANITNLVEKAAQGLVLATEQRGTDAVEEWEVDELLEWTNGLNFDEYLYEWGESGTSGSSIELVSNSKISSNDPFSIMLP